MTVGVTPDPYPRVGGTTEQVPKRWINQRDAATERIVELRTQAEADTATAEPVVVDPAVARQQYDALKAWRAAGSQGEPPATDQLQAMNAEYAGGVRAADRQRTRKGTGAAEARSTSTRRATANARQAQVGFEGRKAYAKPVTDAELDAWIRKVRAEHPGTRREDELEQAYWVEGFKVSRDRFKKAWAATEPDAG